MKTSINKNTIFLRHVALPSDHGSWVFLLSPLLIGLFAGNSWSLATVFLITTSLAAFLLRQPVTYAVKIFSGRRNRRDLPAALFWIGIYGLIATLGLVGLIDQGFAYLLILALPGLPVFSWHLYLVSKRAERRQLGIEIVGSGVLAMSAPAGYWIGVGYLDPVGWLLLVLTWLQSAASIVYAYLRLEQRNLDTMPEIKKRLIMGRRAIIYTSFNLLFVIALGLANLVSLVLFLPYALQFGETVWGTLNPAIGVRPTAIGVRQLIISSLFTLLFIITW
jgi:hypothetical protein